MLAAAARRCCGRRRDGRRRQGRSPRSIAAGPALPPLGSPAEAGRSMAALSTPAPSLCHALTNCLGGPNLTFESEMPMRFRARLGRTPMSSFKALDSWIRRQDDHPCRPEALPLQAARKAFGATRPLLAATSLSNVCRASKSKYRSAEPGTFSDVAARSGCWGR
jgi:hypothetical protein